MIPIALDPAALALGLWFGIGAGLLVAFAFLTGAAAVSELWNDATNALRALQATTGPVVGTFHAAMDRSLARELLSPATVPLMEKLSARIAVSEDARRTAHAPSPRSSITKSERSPR